MPKPETVNNKLRRRHQADFDTKIAERKERHELEDVQLTIARLEKQLAELEPEAQEKKSSQPVAELEAEIAEQVVARERAEAELLKLESAAKLVEEKEAELKEVQEELRSKEAELEDINSKIVILEGTLERVRTRAGEGEQLSAEGEFVPGVERKATSVHQSLAAESDSSALRLEHFLRPLVFLSLLMQIAGLAQGEKIVRTLL
ncbi:hypothetical protein BCR35DRAFT_332814 [Leucosporidium creatinivorum]|uniref:Uncharacterized protein n=1 Tax=Leucosporidium creatinivorum TaxID=106004 RepID=A0A1Y2EYA0_9BASI|nr:hypothetical protein BCR35DRAFT_332814 [Leucosporidium creatinivorum]